VIQCLIVIRFRWSRATGSFFRSLRATRAPPTTSEIRRRQWKPRCGPQRGFVRLGRSAQKQQRLGLRTRSTERGDRAEPLHKPRRGKRPAAKARAAPPCASANAASALGRGEGLSQEPGTAKTRSKARVTQRRKRQALAPQARNQRDKAERPLEWAAKIGRSLQMRSLHHR
jgi:hypothetical protein